MTQGPSISAVIPIYNERASTASAIAEIDAFLASHFRDHEIILVESGSTDGTGEICDGLATRLPRVSVHHEGRRSGFGNAMRLGHALVSKDWTWPFVVDMPYRLDALTAAIPYMDRYDGILSFRSNDPRGAYRRLQSAVFNALGRQLLGVGVRHINSAFKLIKTDVLRRMQLTSPGWLIDAEMVMQLDRLGVPVVELPVELVPRAAGQSSIDTAAVIRTAVELVALARTRRW